MEIDSYIYAKKFAERNRNIWKCSEMYKQFQKSTEIYENVKKILQKLSEKYRNTWKYTEM